MRMLLTFLFVYLCPHAIPLPVPNLNPTLTLNLNPAPLSIPPTNREGFHLLPPSQTGIHFTNHLSVSRSLTNQIYLNGSGVAAGDVDGDGLADLYFCGLDNQNELYRNLGSWRFERITSRAGVACAGQPSTGAALADLDGDFDLDLLVNGIARGTRLFLNDGHARFSEVTSSFGLTSKTGSASLAIADVNRDGFLDIYVVNYRNSTFRDEPEKRFRVITSNGKYELQSVDGRPVTDSDLAGRFTIDPVSGLLEHGEPDALYINESGHRFRRVDWTDGTFTDENGNPITPPYDWGLSAMFRDLNDDGAPDLYVCNDFQSPDRIWINNGHGHFRAAPPSTLRATSLFSMGIDFADLDGDGHEEFFVADMLSRKHSRRQTQVFEGMPTLASNLKFDLRPQVARNTLFWKRGNGTYAEIAQLAGLDATEWSWCPVFLDVDLDGRRDLLVSTGHERDAQNIDIAREIDQARRQNLPWKQQLELRRKFPKLESPILAFRNIGNLSFTEATTNWGFHTSQISQGMALADLDNDGDLDLVANCLNSPALIYRNETTAPRIAIRLRGAPPSTYAVGARISVKVPGLPLQSDQVTAGGRYLSSDASPKSFAAIPGQPATIEVTWPDQKLSRITNAQANFSYELSHTNAFNPPPTHAPLLTPIFQDISAQLNHTHKDEPFDDFQRQPLLPRKFSELGPGVSWFDLDNDGWEDLFIGAGRTGPLAYFHNKRGILTPAKLPQISAPTRRDQTAILGWSHHTNHTLLIAFSNYEDAQTNGPSVISYAHPTGVLASILNAGASSIGALALGDADADGDLDLFAAGRIIPSRYPESASSTFLRNDNGSFNSIPALNHHFEKIGVVTSAIWSDLNSDGKPELLLAIEAGPIRIFTFENDHFRELTAELGLDPRLGWWQSVTTADFNNDGRLDIIAGNLGRNTPYQKHFPGGYHLFYGDLQNDGLMQIIEAAHDPDSRHIVPLKDRDSLALGLPDLRQRYPTFASFSAASISEILADRAPRAKHLHVDTPDSMVFLNEGSRFRAIPLPLQAQFSPVFGLATGDVDADGNTDIFITQNTFSVGKGVSRYDASQGLLLLGDGKGNLTPVPSRKSGIQIESEGRAASFCDFDHDGSLDLVATQNSGATKLYKNNSRRTGLRVRVHGGDLNPHGIGSQLRLHFTDGTSGPLHEIRAGEGYWSQTSSTLVFGKPSQIKHLEILWPGGESQKFAIPEKSTEFTVQK